MYTHTRLVPRPDHTHIFLIPSAKSICCFHAFFDVNIKLLVSTHYNIKYTSKFVQLTRVQVCTLCKLRNNILTSSEHSVIDLYKSLTLVLQYKPLQYIRKHTNTQNFWQKVSELYFCGRSLEYILLYLMLSSMHPTGHKNTH